MPPVPEHMITTAFTLPGYDFQDIYAAAVERASDGGRFVEVGSWKGRSTAFLGVAIINSGKKIQLDCVDTWRGSAEHTKDHDLITNRGNLARVFATNVGEVGHVISMIQKPSTEASRLYDDASLDFVFIDADHSYEAVMDDLRSWLPKIKPGGVIAGHDYYWDGVGRAVREVFGDSHTVSGNSWIHVQ